MTLWTSAAAVVKTHSLAAGATLTPAITDVRIGYPAGIPGRAVRIMYGGEAEPSYYEGPYTGTTKVVAEAIVVVGLWPLSSLTPAAAENIEDEVFAFKDELHRLLMGDFTLSGTVNAIRIELATPDLLNIGGTLYRTLEIEVRADFSEYTTAP